MFWGHNKKEKNKTNLRNIMKHLCLKSMMPITWIYQVKITDQENPKLLKTSKKIVKINLKMDKKSCFTDLFQ